MSQPVNIACLCGKVRESVVLNGASSVRHDICHCNICRQTTGNLFYAALPVMEPPKCYEQLSKYDSSQKVSRYFCSSCGTHVCHRVHRDEAWYVATAVIDRAAENEQVFSCSLQRIAEHQFVADTVDGGLAVCLAGHSGSSARFYMQASDGAAIESLSRELWHPVKAQTQAPARLQAACQCGGVQFSVSKPNRQSRACSSPWPDLLHPYHLSDPSNPEDVKWWLKGSDKYLAGTCACRSCRLSNATPITCWAFIPKANLLNVDDSPLEFSLEQLQSYTSSKGKSRYFCRTCGASAFLRIDERPELIDVSVGLFRAPEGARAEHWFEWCTTRVSFAEEALDTEMIAECELGLGKLNIA